jgi:hypothetical protein
MMQPHILFVSSLHQLPLAIGIIAANRSQEPWASSDLMKISDTAFGLVAGFASP